MLDKDGKSAKTKIAALGWGNYGWFPSQVFTLILWQLLDSKCKYFVLFLKSPFWHSSSLPVTIHLLFFPIRIRCYRPYAAFSITVPMIKELGWEGARDPCSSPRCTTNSDLKPLIIPPNPCGHPGLLLQLQIGHGTLNIQGHPNATGPKATSSPHLGLSILAQGSPLRNVILIYTEYELKKHGSAHGK